MNYASASLQEEAGRVNSSDSNLEQSTFAVSAGLSREEIAVSGGMVLSALSGGTLSQFQRSIAPWW